MSDTPPPGHSAEYLILQQQYHEHVRSMNETLHRLHERHFDLVKISAELGERVAALERQLYGVRAKPAQSQDQPMRETPQ